MEMSFYQAIMVAQDITKTSGWFLDAILWAGETPQSGGEQLFEVVAYCDGNKHYIRDQEEWDKLRKRHALERKKK